MASTRERRRLNVAREILRRTEEAHGVTPGWKSRPKVRVEPDDLGSSEPVAEAVFVLVEQSVTDEPAAAAEGGRKAFVEWAPPGWKPYGRLFPSKIRWVPLPGAEDEPGLLTWANRANR